MSALAHLAIERDFLLELKHNDVLYNSVIEQFLKKEAALVSFIDFYVSLLELGFLFLSIYFDRNFLCLVKVCLSIDLIIAKYWHVFVKDSLMSVQFVYLNSYTVRLLINHFIPLDKSSFHCEYGVVMLNENSL